MGAVDERSLTSRETVLLIADAAGGSVPGRTVMQKLAYFAAINLGAALAHRPYFYGPYSSKVDDALSVASLAGELSETSDRIEDWKGGPDLVRYTYELTGVGTSRVEQIKLRAPAQWQRIQEAVAAVLTAIPDLNQKLLSSAAKTYLIISDGEEIDEDDIPALAARLGWELTPAQVERTVSILQQLDLIQADAE